MEQENFIIPMLDGSTSHELETDVNVLRDQVTSLKSVVNKLQEEIDNKDIYLANIAREKEKISMELARNKRSNAALLKQLEGERKFYFQEKEIYCQEMNEIKELKKTLSVSSVSDKQLNELKLELETAKTKLKQTLEANYNLSIKFLRIKNTKTFLKNELMKRNVEHEKITQDLKNKIQILSDEIEDIIKQRFHLCISPSNRKYIQLVRQNSSLVHENLTLQMDVERLNAQFDKVKLKYTKSETNNRLKYMHSIKSEAEEKHSRKEAKKKIADEKRNEKPEKLPKKCKSPAEVITIFERDKSSNSLPKNWESGTGSKNCIPKLSSIAEIDENGESLLTQVGNVT